jgi:hypothetical protein
MFGAVRNIGAAAILGGIITDFVMYDVDGGTRAVRPLILCGHGAWCWRFL